MKTGKLNIMMVVAVFLAVSGCSTVSVQQLSETYDRPILSAAEAESMIRVEVTPLPAISVEDTVMAATD
ncbi:MAG: hypothetical protein WBM61_15100 [Woeseiaceae bacterium]|jgi:uncharacterized protein YceK